jgi:hypothetical protein
MVFLLFYFVQISCPLDLNLWIYHKCSTSEVDQVIQQEENSEDEGDDD